VAGTPADTASDRDQQVVRDGAAAGVQRYQMELETRRLTVTAWLHRMGRGRMGATRRGRAIAAAELFERWDCCG